MEWILFTLCGMLIFAGGVAVGYLEYSYSENKDILQFVGLLCLIFGLIGVCWIHTSYANKVEKENTNECICCS